MNKYDLYHTTVIFLFLAVYIVLTGPLTLDSVLMFWIGFMLANLIWGVLDE